MKFIPAAIFVFATTLTFAQDSANVLFIGNSYTFVNDLPSLLSQLATSFGDNVQYDQSLQGGATLNTHASNSNTYVKINSDDWDYVVLQAQSQEPSFEDSQVDAQTIPYAMQLADSVYANHFCSEVMLFMTWGRENGDPQWEPISTYEGMQYRLRNAYMRMADSVQGSVSPVGMAWWHIRENYPSIQLYSPDGSHPSLEGSYLAACTFYASIFRKSPVGAPFISTLDPITAVKLQDAAALMVLDSLDQWHLRPFSEHTQAEFSYSITNGTVTFTNESNKAQTYSWDFGNGQSGTVENPSVTYSATGSYTVTLIAESECDTDTISYEIVIDQLGLWDQEHSEIKLLTNGNGHFEVLTPSSVNEITVMNMSGQEIVRTNENQIDLSVTSPGIYFFRIETEAGENVLKVQR